MGRAWRRTCPATIRRTQERATGDTAGLFLLRQAGPAAYVIADASASQRVTVYLGELHACTCRDYVTTKDLCLHIVWVLMKKLKLKASDPLSFQRGLGAGELSRALAGPVSQPAKRFRLLRRRPEERMAVAKRLATLADSCPICLDPFAARPIPICHCKYGCGQAVHVRCLVVLGKHQARAAVSLPPSVTCPLCRGEFCLWPELNRLEIRLLKMKSKLEPLPVHPVTCTICDDAPVKGCLYRCLPCSEVIVCASCLANGSLDQLHAGHPIAVKTKPGEKWRPVRMPSSDEGSHSSRRCPALQQLSLPQGAPVPSVSKMALESGSIYKVPTLEQMIEATILLQENLLFGPARNRSLTNIRKVLKRKTQVKLPPPEVRVHRVELFARNEPQPDSPKKLATGRVRRQCQQDEIMRSVKPEPKAPTLPEVEEEETDDDTRWSGARAPVLAVTVYPRASVEESAIDEEDDDEDNDDTSETAQEDGSNAGARCALEMATARLEGPPARPELRERSGLEARNWSFLRAKRWASSRTCTSAY